MTKETKPTLTLEDIETIKRDGLSVDEVDTFDALLDLAEAHLQYLADEYGCPCGGYAEHLEHCHLRRNTEGGGQ